MRLLLLALGAASLACVGWVCWHATTETREWRELLTLGAKANRTEPEELRFKLLARRRVPDGSAAGEPWQVASQGSGPESRVVVLFVSGDCRGPLRVQVFDESRRRISTNTVDVGAHPCGLSFKAGPSSLSIQSSTPVGCTIRHFVLRNDRLAPANIDGQD